MDILSNEQRVKNSIKLGESHFREFKAAVEGRIGHKRPRPVSSICKDIGEALVAFANADGGDLFIGVEDDGIITGLQHSEDDIKMMMRAATTHVLNGKNLPILRSDIIEVEDKKVLMFSVDKSRTTIFQMTDGRCMKRKDKSTMPISFEKIMMERSEEKSREYDREFVDGASVSDLDIDMLGKIANDYMPGMSPEQYLQQLNLGEYVSTGMKIRRAAILLFAKNISRWEPRCQVRILKVKGNKILAGEQYNVIADEYVTGNIFQLIQNAWERLRPYLSEKVSFGIDAKFEQQYSYPESACREALINAIAHRDYATQNPIVVSFFNDHLEFESPGELLSGISIEALRKHEGIHESRNTYIARVLREGKFMREMGEGLNRIYQLMAEQELAEPELFSEKKVYKITLHHKSVYSQKEQNWLNLFQGFELNTDQKRVVIIGMDNKEIAPKDIYNALRSDDRNRYDQCVTALRIKGILEKIRSNREVTQISKTKNIERNAVPRFKIVMPDKAKEYKSSKIFVYNLPDNCTKEILNQELSIFGKIKRIELAKSKFSGKRGYANVEFETIESALKALAIKHIRLDEKILSIYRFRENVNW